jgi:Domain of unknown function (DUF6438)
VSKSPPLSRSKIRLLHEILLCLNLSLVSFYFLVTHYLNNASLSSGTSDAYAFLYCFFRAAVKINDFLHVGSLHPDAARWPNAGGTLGVELAFVISVVCIGLVLLSLLQFVRNSRSLKFVLNPFAGSVVLLAFPAAHILLFINRDPATSAMRWPPLSLIAEFICFGPAFLIHLRHPVAIRVIGFLMLFHYCFWFLILFKHDRFDTISGPVPPPLLLLLIPLGGALWLRYSRTPPGDSPLPPRTASRKKWSLVGTTSSAAVLAVLWLPGRGYSLVRAKNPDSLNIEMRRSTCQTSCPDYTVIIHGSGKVEYIGEHFVRIHGPQESLLPQEQLQAVLKTFDHANFFSLEDQAFAWGYHTSRVTVKITVDGKTKEVTSDAYHIGAKSGAQAKFVSAAAAIDRVVGTDRWVKCDDSRCQF